MTLTIQIHDLETNELADISGIALEKSVRPKHNESQIFTVQAPAAHSLLNTIAGDGFPNLRRGNRKLLVWEDDEILHHGRIWSVERNGDGTRNRATIISHDPLMEFGSDEHAGRPVRDATGNLIDPTFASTAGGGQTEISGPDLIKQAIENTISADGPLPVVLGDFDLAVGPAIDLTPSEAMDWPIMLGDFISRLVETGVVDIRLRPVDPSEMLDPYAMVELSAKNSIGTDRSGTVHFDYWTGSKNAAQARFVSDFSTINNKLFDYLGPRLDQTHWRGLITPDGPYPDEDWPTEFNDAIAASRARYGVYMGIRVYDTLGNENDSRPLFVHLYKAEQMYRVEPRDMLYITPAAGSHALYTPPQDFDIGDLIATNVGGALGVDIAATQRVYCYTKTWDRNDVARVTDLLTSADPA